MRDMAYFFFFSFTLFSGPRRSLNLKLSDTRVYEPQIRARLGTGGGAATSTGGARGRARHGIPHPDALLRGVRVGPPPVSTPPPEISIFPPEPHES